MPKQGAVSIGHDGAVFLGLAGVTVDMGGLQVVVSVRPLKATGFDMLYLPFLALSYLARADMADAAAIAKDSGALVGGE